MRTFLITWNPKRWDWTDLAEDVAAVACGRRVDSSWSCGRRKDIGPDDRVFLLRQGKEPRGIVGSGWVTSEPFLDEHWEPGHGGSAIYVRLSFDTLLDSDSDPHTVMRIADLPTSLRRGIHWNTQSSGIVVSPPFDEEIEAAWARHLTKFFAGDGEIDALEGELRSLHVVHRRRERRLREEKIAATLRLSQGRLRCEVPGCGFDFLDVYGETGRGYAQVHHLDPLGARDTPQSTSLASLVVVCANCHAMIHRHGACRSLDGLVTRS